MAVLGIALANMMDLTATDGSGQRHADSPRTASMSFHLVNHGPATVVPNFHVAADGPLDALVGDDPVSCFGEICMLDHELAPGASVDMSFVAQLGDGETHVTITASALGVDELTPADNITMFTIPAAPPSDGGGCATTGDSGLALAMLAMPLLLRRRR